MMRVQFAVGIVTVVGGTHEGVGSVDAVGAAERKVVGAADLDVDGGRAAGCGERHAGRQHEGKNIPCIADKKRNQGSTPFMKGMEKV